MKKNAFVQGLDQYLHGAATAQQFARDLVTDTLQRALTDISTVCAIKYGDLWAVAVPHIDQAVELPNPAAGLCHGFKKNGVKCTRRILCEGYCGFHQDQRRTTVHKKRRLETYEYVPPPDPYAFLYPPPNNKTQ